jgi:two-component system CheB/CheR fusion protein
VETDNRGADVAVFPIVGIGASAGGLEATQQLLRALPPNLGMAFVVIQHLSPTYESMLADILSRSTAMPVVEVHDEPAVEPNHVYVIPPNRSMSLSGGKLALQPRASPNGYYRPIDEFFSSLAQDPTHVAIGVVLSGTGRDGTAGLQAIKAEGGITFAQDGSAQQEGMPNSAIATGCVDFVLPPAGIAAEIARIGKHPYVALRALPHRAEELSGRSDVEPVLQLLQQRTGVDFSQYKVNTLFRRINRRAVLLHAENLEQYAAHLQNEPREVEALYQDILINVTSFFRNPEAFEVLKTEVLAPMLQKRGPSEPLRVWSIGCSSGEEAYSIAISIAELGSERGGTAQIYATDLNGAAVDRARHGFYPKGIAQDVSPERMRRFFAEADAGYRVSKRIREMCIFARHNVLSDPPFSRMDLICCRNVLIYMDPGLQRKLMPLLHYALKPDGFLFLGTSETIGSYRELFDVVDAKHKIYSRKAGAVRPETPLPSAGGRSATVSLQRRPELARDGTRDAQGDVLREADRVLLSHYGPAGVLVNAEFEVLQFRGDTGHYLAPAPGKASLNVLKMARQGLLVSLRNALQKATKEHLTVREEGVRVRANGGFREVDLVVIPVTGPPSAGRCLMVLFEDKATVRHAPPPNVASNEPVSNTEDAERDRARLTQELAATREYLQSVIEQQEAANEELQSANEEVQSANEELQSINEELETSKEEIQSSNEELTTVNEELQNRNAELDRANNDYNNLLASAQVAIVMLWADLRIRRFTPMAAKLLNLIASDVDRSIGDIQIYLEDVDIPELARQVIDSVSTREIEVRDKAGRWYSLRLRPYRTTENQIDGAVILLVDIHDLKRGQEALARQARILDQTHEPITVRAIDGRIVFWNQGAERLYGYTREEALGRTSHELLQTALQGGVAQIEQALQRDQRWSGELAQRTKDGRTIVVEINMVRVEEHDQPLVIETGRDVTQRNQLEEDLRARVRELAAADEQKNQFVAMLAHELRNPLAPMRNALDILKTRGPIDPESDRLRDMLDRQVSKMSRIVSDLLEAARVNRSHIDLRKVPVPLQTVLERAVELLAHAAKSQGQVLSASLPPAPLVVLGDPTRLEQVFANVIENAIKFTPEGGRIEVELRADAGTQSGRGEAVVRVKDNGVGIPPQLLPRVFDLFTQADDSLDRSRGGLGIGLSLVRGLVERHDGSVSVQSEGVGRGAQFEVRLPLLGTAPPARPARVRAPAPRARHASVLLLDDNDDFLTSMAMLFELSGYEVKTAHTGQEALDLLRQYIPAAMVLDIGLPGMDGYEIAKQVRADPRLKDIVLVALTGYGDETARRRTLEAGFDHHLLKPASIEALLTVLGRPATRDAGKLGGG